MCGLYTATLVPVGLVNFVDVGRAAISGDYASILPHLWWVIGYAVVILVIAIIVFRKKMSGDK